MTEYLADVLRNADWYYVAASALTFLAIILAAPTLAILLAALEDWFDRREYRLARQEMRERDWSDYPGQKEFLESIKNQPPTVIKLNLDPPAAP